MAMRTRPRAEAEVEGLEVAAYTVPVDADEPESDGTLAWDSTTIVVVEAHGGGRLGLGYTYADVSAAAFVESLLVDDVRGADALAPAAVWRRLAARIRNAGRPGVGFMALSAVDVALWDLKAKLLELPLYRTLNAYRDEVPVYGSGGFTSYPTGRLVEQLAGWVERGIPRVKLKVSRHPDRDPERLAAVRESIGPDPVLMVDANGALGQQEALRWAWRFREEWDVAWFEEPVSSADVEGLRLVREQGPPGLEVAAGEYAFVLRDFRNLLDAKAVDCLQADVTRCGGITGLLAVGGLAAAHGIDVSAHGAPSISAHAFCGVERARHLELFHDHERVERLVFDGTLPPDGGMLRPDPDRPGLGLELKPDAEVYRA
jgi:L-alanine-DL-glutamate epimerase-like enolase superfamily enzyme